MAYRIVSGFFCACFTKINLLYHISLDVMLCYTVEFPGFFS